MYGKEAHDALDEPMYHIEFLAGSVEFAPAPPGFTRVVHRDVNGVVTRDEMNHYVCMSTGGDHCVFCGKEMSK
jgi:hypothetical protein